ncbi:MAG: hypothetical protein ACOC2N_03970 [Spirochaetota bacterium]
MLELRQLARTDGQSIALNSASGRLVRTGGGEDNDVVALSIQGATLSAVGQNDPIDVVVDAAQAISGPIHSGAVRNRYPDKQLVVNCTDIVLHLGILRRPKSLDRQRKLMVPCRRLISQRGTARQKHDRHSDHHQEPKWLCAFEVTMRASIGAHFAHLLNN